MTKLRSEFLSALQERGYIHQCSDLQGLDAKAADGIVTAYVGYDATADSLHVGSLVSIMMLRWMQRTGQRPIVLMGGGTTKVGDPPEKTKAASCYRSSRSTPTSPTSRRSLRISSNSATGRPTP